MSHKISAFPAATTRGEHAWRGQIEALVPTIDALPAIAATVGKMGVGILVTLSKLVLLMYGGLIVFAVIVIGVLSLLRMLGVGI